MTEEFGETWLRGENQKIDVVSNNDDGDDDDDDDVIMRNNQLPFLSSI